MDSNELANVGRAVTQAVGQNEGERCGPRTQVSHERTLERLSSNAPLLIGAVLPEGAGADCRNASRNRPITLKRTHRR